MVDQSDRRPNILLITADQMRYDCYGAAAHPVVRTPHLDALVARGVRFTNAYTPFPLCVPARLSILSGQYPHAHGVMGNRGMIPPSQPTLASLLCEAGYRTGAIGKMHFWPPYNPFGFEHMQLAEQEGPAWKIDDYHSVYLAERGLVDEWDRWDQQRPYRNQAPKEYWDTFGARASTLPEEHYHTTWIANRTVDFINAPDDRPFLAWTSFIKPHHPFDPPRPWDAMYDIAGIPPREDQGLALSKPLMTNGGRRDPRQVFFNLAELSQEAYQRVAAYYYATISHIDHHVGRIMDALAASGKLQNTIVLFTSDHGDYMGQYGLILKQPNLPYDALAKVPFIMAGPGCQAGVTVDSLVSLVDILPTATALAGARTPTHVQGRSLEPLLCAPASSSASWRDAVFSETMNVKAVRTREYKYLYNHRSGIDELYRIEDDPSEVENLSLNSAYDGVRAGMRERLLGWYLETEWDRYVGDWGYRNMVTGSR